MYPNDKFIWKQTNKNNVDAYKCTGSLYGFTHWIIIASLLLYQIVAAVLNKNDLGYNIMASHTGYNSMYSSYCTVLNSQSITVPDSGCCVK